MIAQIYLLAVLYVYSETFRSMVGNLAVFLYFNTALAPHLTDLLWQWGFGSSPRLAMQFWFHADLPFECKWTLARLVTTFPFVAIGLALSTVRGRLDSLGWGERAFLFLA